MDEEGLLSDIHQSTQKKRKWSPQDASSESPIMNGHYLSGDVDESSSDHTLAAEATSFGAQTTNKRLKLHRFETRPSASTVRYTGPHVVPGDRSQLPPELWQHENPFCKFPIPKHCAMELWTRIGLRTNHLAFCYKNLQLMSPHQNLEVFKETDLLFSSSSALIPALPFAFFTSSLNFVASVTLRNNSPPPDLQLTKYYFSSQLDDIKREMDRVRALGNAAAEEWYKGLENSRQEKLVDASRWEQWELTRGLEQLLKSREEEDLRQRSNLEQSAQNPAVPDVVQDRQQSGKIRMKPLLDVDTRIKPSATSLAFQDVPASLPPKPTTPASQFNFSNHMQPQIPMPKPIQPHVPRPRVERSIRDVTEMKANKRADIERRCLELDPPILASTLVYMDSFAAAIQIPMALTDAAWEVLKPRLVAQREVAEEREQEQRAASQVLQAKTEDRRLQEAQLKEARETLDREWEEMQRPVREKVNIYADEIIKSHYREGDAVTKDTCPQFAADVLMYVRKRFYEMLSQEDATLTHRGIPIPQDLPNEAPTRKLTLENMKWVFESKIKPLTERHRKDIFLCSACDNASKYYALDAVIQHYAAKHTSALSMGTAVVYWRADWPEDPPFNPNPNAAKVISYLPLSNMSSAPKGEPDATLPPYIMNGGYYSNAEHPQYPPNYRTLIYQAPSPESHHIRPYPAPHLMSQPGPHPISPPGASYGVIHSDNLSYGQQPSMSYAAPTRPYEVMHSLYHPAPALAISPFQRVSFPARYPEGDLRPASAFSPASHHGAYQPSNGVFHPQHRIQPAQGSGRQFHPGPPGQPFGIYQVQIEELARNAREIWNGTSGIQDLPSSVRVKVIIHHVVLRFANKFTNEPNLALFTDALNNNSQMKPLRDLDRLSCKACASSEDMRGTFQDYSPGSNGEKILHVLPALLAHFQSAHVESGRPNMILQTGIEIPRPDWKFDMVELPQPPIIRNLMYSPGIDFTKLSLIATVLPNYFPSPLPRIEAVPDVEDGVDRSTEEPDNPLGRGLHKVHGSDSQYTPQRSQTANMQDHTPRVRSDGIEVTVDNFPKFVDSPLQEAQQHIEPAGEDEYDPHRPAYVQPDRNQSGTTSFPRALQHRELETSLGSEPLDTHGGFSDLDRSYRPSSSTRFSLEQGRQFRARPAIDSPTHANQLNRVEGLSAAVTFANRRGHREDSPSDRIEIYAPRRLTKPIPADTTTASDPLNSGRNDAQASPLNEPLSAAEQFLNNFDPIGDASTYQDQDLRSRQRSDSVNGLDWPPQNLQGTSGNNTRGMPTEAITQNIWHGRARSPILGTGHRQEDNRYVVETNEFGRRGIAAAAGSRHIHGQFQTHETRYSRDSVQRQAKDIYDGYSSDRDGSQHPQTISPSGVEPLPADAVFYRERDAEPRQQLRQVYAPSSPETFRTKRPIDEANAYTRAAPTRQYRYVEDPRYNDVMYGAPVEYIRVAQLESQAPGRYYVERPAPREQGDEYVEYGAEYRREQEVLGHNGQMYARGQDPQDPYARHIRYH